MHQDGISPEKLEANRNNALKSTGPTTTAGKAASSLNNLKHGLLSRQVVIQEGENMENREEFAHFKEALWQDLQPVGVLEELLVDKIAIESWRLQRAIKYETEEMRRGSAFVNISSGVPMDKILRYQITINRQLFQAMNQLERLQRARKGDVVPAPINIEVSGDR